MPLFFILLLMLSLWFFDWRYMATLVILWVFYFYWERLDKWNIALLVTLAVATWALSSEGFLTAVLFWMYWQRRKLVVQWRKENTV